MSKEQTSGLLSKVVRFVRHPTTSWDDLDTTADQRGISSKEALKDIIERKRRNDFVRKREFEMLRRLRLANKGKEADADQRGRLSFFQSSYNSKPDDRAGTLKKIDEIEAQMSMQWWKTKRGDLGNPAQQASEPAAHSAGSEAIDTTLAFNTTVALDVEPGLSPSPQMQPQQGARAAGNGAASTQLSSGSVSAAPPVVPPTVVGPVGLASSQPEVLGKREFEASQFSLSKFNALDVAETAADPEIEEAAIRFASGDAAAAEQSLVEVLSRKGETATPDEWLVLLDLYRATGQDERFEAMALEFADRFSRSAPQWCSIVAEASARMSRSSGGAMPQTRAHWTAEPELDIHIVNMMTRVLERSAPPWVLDWTPLQTMDQAAVEQLHKVFLQWIQTRMELHFVGVRTLLQVLAAMTPAGDSSVSQIYWQLRLSALRLMNLSEEFEQVALDFCITYEISPPSWEPPLCHFVDLSETGTNVGGRGEVNPRSQSNKAEFDLSAGLTILEELRVAEPIGELVGELSGDLTATLQALDEVLGEAELRLVSCKHLVRVDFAAAGSILNWAAAHKAQGRRVRFVHVHRLISAFFHVIGITAHAEVVPRED